MVLSFWHYPAHRAWFQRTVNFVGGMGNQLLSDMGLVAKDCVERIGVKVHHKLINVVHVIIIPQSHHQSFYQYLSAFISIGCGLYQGVPPWGLRFVLRLSISNFQFHFPPSSPSLLLIHHPTPPNSVYVHQL